MEHNDPMPNVDYDDLDYEHDGTVCCVDLAGEDLDLEDDIEVLSLMRRIIAGYTPAQVSEGLW
jgi:hypothetical protein